MTRDKEDGGVPARLAALRERMRASGMDAYLVPSGDFHGSENMGEYFQCRAYITGFTGSAGTAAILPESAGLWTDGRYFVQAEAQLLGSGISLFKMGQEGVPDLEDYLAEQLPGGLIGQMPPLSGDPPFQIIGISSYLKHMDIMVCFQQ